MSTSRKFLCSVYAVIAIVALIATWSQALTYFHDSNFFSATVTFWKEAKLNPASRFLTADILLFGFAATILMVIEARKYDIKFVWAYFLVGFLIAVSVTFPLFLIAREFRMADSGVERLRPLDTVLLALLSVGIAVFVVWVDCF